MNSRRIEIISYSENLRHQMISVWERSARATHHFVKPTDLDEYKRLILGKEFFLKHAEFGPKSIQAIEGLFEKYKCGSLFE